MEIPLFNLLIVRHGKLTYPLYCKTCIYYSLNLYIHFHFKLGLDIRCKDVSCKEYRVLIGYASCLILYNYLLNKILFKLKLGLLVASLISYPKYCTKLFLAHFKISLSFGIHRLFQQIYMYVHQLVF